MAKNIHIIDVSATFRGPGRPITTSGDDLLHRAKELGGSAPLDGELKGITVPHLDVERAFNYASKQDEVRFDKGTLTLTLTQTVYLLNTMTECESKLWRAHEMMHVQDYTSIVNELKGTLINEAIGADKIWKARFIDRTWISISDVDAEEERLVQHIVDLFVEKARDANSLRDTPEKYARVDQSVRERCTQGSGGRRPNGARQRTAGRERPSTGR